MRFMVDSNVNGLMFQLGNIMRIDNGFVEESVCFNTAGGYIVVSYNDTSMGRNNRQQVRLNINRNTKIINFRGQNLCTCCIQEGMWINAIFSRCYDKKYSTTGKCIFNYCTGKKSAIG